MKCLNCGKLLSQIEGKKARVFCNDACRMAYKRKFKSEQGKSEQSKSEQGKSEQIKSEQIKSEQPNPNKYTVVEGKADKHNIPPDIKKLSKEELYARIDHYPADTWKDSLEFKELKRRLNSMSLKDLKEQGYWIPSWKLADN